MVAYAQRRHGRREFADAVLAEAVVPVGGQMGQLRDEDSPSSPSVQVTRVTPAPLPAYIAMARRC